MKAIMALKKPEWPENGDLVIATIQQVTDFGAYAKLDEYDKQGLLHISEISSSWIRNIRDFVREGQKIVLKVLRVDTEKRHIDLSLRRVTKRERIEKMMFYKKDRKADTLLRGIAEKTGLSLAEVYEKVGAPVEKEYGLYEGFEKVAREGAEVLTKLGVPENIAKAFVEISQERIKLPLVRVKGTLELSCIKPNGVKIIKDAFLNAGIAEKTPGAKFRFYVIAAPKYAVEVMAENYKSAEDVMQKLTDDVVSNVEKAGGQGVFRREK